MSNIRNQSAPVNGDATVSEQKLQDFDDRYGDLIRDPGWLAWAKSQFREAAVADTWPRQAGLRILIIIIERFNGAKGYAWPSYDELAECTLLSRRTAIRWVARLDRLGWIFIKARSTGRGNANELVLNFDRIADAIAEKAEKDRKGDRRKGDSCGGLRSERVTDVGGLAPETGTSVTPTTTPTRSENGVLEWTDAGRSPADAGRARAGEVAPKKAAPGSLFERLWALPWIDKSFKARNAAKRAVDETKARADAPPDDLLVAKAESYLAHVPRAEQRWLSVWLRGEGWLCDESPPKPDRAPKANGKAAPERGVKLRVGMVLRSDEGNVVKVLSLRDDKVEVFYLECPSAPDLMEGKKFLHPRESYEAREDWFEWDGKPLPESPIQARAREAGLVVGARVRDVTDVSDADDYERHEGIGEVIGTYSGGLVIVQWPDSSYRLSLGEHEWARIQVVAP
jgi:Helix-turn-helix domain